MIAADVKADILNEALIALKQPLLSNPDAPSSYIEKLAVNRLDNAIDEVLELRPWSGAIEEAQLARLASDSLAGHARYQLPQDCVRVNFVRGLRQNHWRTSRDVLMIGRPYRAGGDPDDVISRITIAYNSRKTSPFWSANLRTLIGIRLARKLTGANEASAAAKARIDQDFATQLRMASAVQGARESSYVWREDLI